MWRSCQTVKADAASRVFMADCRDLTWAVVDTGIDARHPAFRLRDEEGKAYPEPFMPSSETNDGKPVNRTRVKATYDFSIIRDLLDASASDWENLPESLKTRLDADPQLKAEAGELEKSLRNGREIDWKLLEKLLQIPHTSKDYRAPVQDHGTHVAGILAGDWCEQTRDGYQVQGMCPGLNLMDLRVFDDEGIGDEFTVMAALQYLRWLNAHRDFMVVHGVNLSVSIPHDVANYACGRTPVCAECERLVNAGLVVVAAAGNKGYLQYMTSEGPEDGYRSISITDPGNADAVITVGSTHRLEPHNYGVSYFSSRGPSGDGRIKPDLVAPGEKIESAIPDGGLMRKDGTSMAAPHVSGAAALLMARHRELLGQPRKVKQILCDSATDLGRERYFQGCGLVDVLRSLQSV